MARSLNLRKDAAEVCALLRSLNERYPGCTNTNRVIDSIVKQFNLEPAEEKRLTLAMDDQRYEECQRALVLGRTELRQHIMQVPLNLNIPLKKAELSALSALSASCPS